MTARAHKAVLIAGPTACGKSALAVALARRHDGVVINADSMQIYRDLAILSARPDTGEQNGVPHRLFGIRDAAHPCSVAEWHDLAMAEIDDAWRAHRLPILVGGTGLYFKSLLSGLAPVPDIPAAIRAGVRARLSEEGADAIHAALQREDPAMAARLRPADGQRLARALEVVRATGRSLAAYQADTRPGGLAAADADGQVIKRVADLPRRALYACCDARFDAMILAGALDEVRALAARGLDPALPAMKALGVPPLLACLDGATDLATAVSVAQRDTRRYAKRQATWMRTQFADWPRLDMSQPDAALANLESALATSTDGSHT